MNKVRKANREKMLKITNPNGLHPYPVAITQPKASDDIFSFSNFGNVRTHTELGETWFVAKDVSDILGYRDAPDMVRYLDDDEKNTITLNEGIRGNPNHTVISESGLYSAIFRSQRPEAKAFKKWVTSEVLPSIRKNGYYIDKERMHALELEMLKTNRIDRFNLVTDFAGEARYHYQDDPDGYRKFAALTHLVPVRMDEIYPRAKSSVVRLRRINRKFERQGAEEFLERQMISEMMLIEIFGSYPEFSWPSEYGSQVGFGNAMIAQLVKDGVIEKIDCPDDLRCYLEYQEDVYRITPAKKYKTK